MRPRIRAVMAVALTATAMPRPSLCRAQDDAGLFGDWERRASAIQAEQPHWMTPLVTVTPRLEQELRGDVLWRTAPSGDETTIYGNGKGVELIPLSPLEVIVGVPAYTVHRNPKARDGWGDWPLLLKYRILSNNETHGNDIITPFLGATLATGGKANGNGVTVLTPTLAGGKGWDQLDVQTTVGVNLPTGNTTDLGHALLYNGTLQYHASQMLWPQVELNGTTWRDGKNAGKTQLFVTPGAMFGRFRLHDRLGVAVGGGVQIAATAFHQFDHNYILSARLPF